MRECLKSKWRLSPSTKINCDNKAKLDIITLYRISPWSLWGRGEKRKWEKSAVFPPCGIVHSSFGLVTAEASRLDRSINWWRGKGRWLCGSDGRWMWTWGPELRYVFVYSLNGPASNSQGSFLIIVKCLRLCPCPLTPDSSDKWMWKIVSRALRLPFLGKIRSCWKETGFKIK